VRGPSGRVVPALHHSKEGRMARSSRESAVKPRPASGGVATVKTVRNGKSAADARKDLLERAGRNGDGVSRWRSDPLADAKAARRVADLAQAHAPELSRRGLTAAYTEAARRLADEIEDHLQALPAAAVTARGRSREEADLLADAAATAQTAREAVQRVTRGADGRRAAHAFGIGQPFSVRQAQHVLRALRMILDAAKLHPEVASDAGLIPEDLQTMRDLAGDVEKLPGAGAPLTDEAQALVEAQGALRAYFDLLAAKATLAFAGDPEERARLLSLLPRADDRRHLRRSAADEIPAA
jgi:hypothetical protein